MRNSNFTDVNLAVKDSLYSLFYELKSEIQGTNIEIDEQEYEENLKSTTFNQLVGYLRENIRILIKKYSLLGYKIFNLGEIHHDYINHENKYHGQYMYKIGFGGNIVEYPQNLLLVINKTMYNTYMNFKKLKPKKKSN